MRKKIAALGLASAMVLSMASIAMATQPTNAVGAIEGNAYKYDSDKSAVLLTNPNPSFSYGDTLYYPLLSQNSVNNSEAITNAQQALKAAQQAKTDADSALTAAQSAATEKAEALAAAEAMAAKANAVKTAATAWLADSENETLKNAYIAALAAYDNTLTPAATAAEADVQADELVAAANGAVTTATNEKTQAAAAVTAAEGTVAEKAADVTAAQEVLNGLLNNNFRYVYEYDAIRGIKIKQNWDMNGKLVNNVEIVKKKAVASSELSQKFIYFVAVNLKESTTTSEADITGTIQLRKSGTDGFDYEERELAVNVAVGYAVAEDTTITDKLQLFKSGVSFQGDTEEEFRFSADEDSYFTVNTIGQGKLLLKADAKFDSKIADKNPEANLDFFNGNGAKFNKTGVLTLAANEGSYLYRVNSDGSLTKLNAEYDEYEEAFQIKTRSIDRYVISDVALKNVSADSNNNNNGSNNNGPTVTPNPPMGAAL